MLQFILAVLILVVLALAAFVIVRRVRRKGSVLVTNVSERGEVDR